MTPAEARAAARRILDRPEYQERRPPRPLRGVLEWIGERFAPVGRAVDDVGGNRLLAVGVAAAILVTAGVVTALVIRHRAGAASGGAGWAPAGGRRERPGELDRRADAAERGGDLELALRLRFRAGLLRLDEAGVLSYRASLTTGTVTRAVTSPALARMASTLEEVVYGRRPASLDDLAEARAGWPAVLREVAA